MGNGNSRIYVRALLIAAAVGLALPFFVRRTVSLYTDGDGVREEAPAAQSFLRDVLWRRPERIPGFPRGDHHRPQLSPLGDTLIFAVGQPGLDADLWIARREGRAWLPPEPLDVLNSEGDELGVSFRGDGRAVVFASNRAGGHGGFDLWESVWVDGLWQEPRNLGPTVNTAWHEIGPAQREVGASTSGAPSASHDRLFFASNRRADVAPPAPGTVPFTRSLTSGGYDVYACDLRWGDLTVGAPLDSPLDDSLGASVASEVIAVEGLNRPGSSELGITFSPSNDFVYFASDREGGAGGYDLFRARVITGQGYGDLAALGPQVNTPADELDPSVGGHGFELFFSSNREGAEAVFVTVAREVYLAREKGETYWSFVAVLVFLRNVILQTQPAILALLLSLLLCLVAWLVLRGRFGRLDLVLRCLVVALVTHLLLVVWMDTSRIQRLLLQSFREADYEFVEVAADGSFEEDVSFAIRTTEAETDGDAAPTFQPSARPLERQRSTVEPESAELAAEAALALLAGQPTHHSRMESLETPALDEDSRALASVPRSPQEVDAVSVNVFEEPSEPLTPSAPRREGQGPQEEPAPEEAELTFSAQDLAESVAAPQPLSADAARVAVVEDDVWRGQRSASPERPDPVATDARGGVQPDVVPSRASGPAGELASRYEGTPTQQLTPVEVIEAADDPSLALGGRQAMTPAESDLREATTLELEESQVVPSRFVVGTEALVPAPGNVRLPEVAQAPRAVVVAPSFQDPEPDGPEPRRVELERPPEREAPEDAQLASAVPRRSKIRETPSVKTRSVLNPSRSMVATPRTGVRRAPQVAPTGRVRRARAEQPKVAGVATPPRVLGSRYRPALRKVPQPAVPPPAAKPPAELAVAATAARLSTASPRPVTRQGALVLQSTPSAARARLKPSLHLPAPPPTAALPTTTERTSARPIPPAPRVALSPLRPPQTPVVPPRGIAPRRSPPLEKAVATTKPVREPPVLERRPMAPMKVRGAAAEVSTVPAAPSALSRRGVSLEASRARVIASTPPRVRPEPPSRGSVGRVGVAIVKTEPKTVPSVTLAHTPPRPTLPPQLVRPERTGKVRRAPEETSPGPARGAALASARRPFGSQLSLPTVGGANSVPLPAVPDARVVFLPPGPERLVRRSRAAPPDAPSPALPVRAEVSPRSLVVVARKTHTRPRALPRHASVGSAAVPLRFAAPRAIEPAEPQLAGLPTSFRTGRVVPRPTMTGAHVVAAARAVRPIALAAAPPGLETTRPEVARLEKRSRFVPRVYEMRGKANRGDALRKGGGTALTEAAVERGLAWLALHQSPDGRWSLYNYASHLPDVSPRDLKHPDWSGRRMVESRGGSGRARSGDTAATGLALLCFLGHGDTHTEPGPYQEAVQGGLDWLLSAQARDGDLRGDGNLYMHAIASFALCEAYAFTRDPELREPAQRSIDFTVRSQNPRRGGWRYLPYPKSNDVDTSVFGWMLMAVKSAKLGGLDLDSRCLQRAGRYLDSARMTPAGGRYAYQPKSTRTSLAMTAQGLFCHQLLSDVLRDRTSEVKLGLATDESVRYLLNHVPQTVGRSGLNFYYWYYGTLALFQNGGRPWKTWNESVSRLVVLLQLGEEHGTAAGSWDPRDRRAAFGGRVYATAMSVLVLEVYYRYAQLGQTE